MAESEQAKGAGGGKPSEARAVASPAPPRVKEAGKAPATPGTEPKAKRQAARAENKPPGAAPPKRASRPEPLPLAQGEYPLPLESEPPPPPGADQSDADDDDAEPLSDRARLEPAGASTRETALRSSSSSSQEAAPVSQATSGRMVGCCELFTEIAHGGMATIHLGRWLGAGGFAKAVAVKALHPNYARDPDFVAMFMDEARVVAGIRHPNVMPTIDLVEEEGELFIVMEYVEGVTLAHLLRRAWEIQERVPVAIVLRIVTGVLHGLHAAHEAKNTQGEPMCVIHRDVSPENIMVGVDGHPRLIDFGIATALDRYSRTRDGELKGKLAYLAPEQVLGAKLTRRTDVFAASIVLWQALTGRKLFGAESVVEAAHKILNMPLQVPSAVSSRVPKGLDRIVMRGLERDPTKRWATADAMAEALEAAGTLATYSEVGSWVRRAAKERLGRNAQAVAAMSRAPVAVDSPQLSQPLSVYPAERAEMGDDLTRKIDAFEGVGGDDVKTDVTTPDAARLSPALAESHGLRGAAKPVLYALGAVGLLGLGLWLGMNLKGGAERGSPGATRSVPGISAASGSGSSAGPGGTTGLEPGAASTASAPPNAGAQDAGPQGDDTRDAGGSEPMDASAKPWAPTPGGGKVPTGPAATATGSANAFIPPDI
jgi:hypothetical protein